MCAPRAGTNSRPSIILARKITSGQVPSCLDSSLTPRIYYPETVTDTQAPTLNHWVITLVCADQSGIVHDISGAIVAAGGNITESQQFSSADTGRFFMRLQVESAAARDEVEAALAPVVARFDMSWTLDIVGRPLRTLVLASTAAHCVNDLLFRQRGGQLPIEVPLVLANHPTLAPLAEFYAIVTARPIWSGATRREAYAGVIAQKTPWARPPRIRAATIIS